MRQRLAAVAARRMVERVPRGAASLRTPVTGGEVYRTPRSRSQSEQHANCRKARRPWPGAAPGGYERGHCPSDSKARGRLYPHAVTGARYNIRGIVEASRIRTPEVACR